jgi:hypothetical protein
LDEAFHAHKKIGPGMLESVYKPALDNSYKREDYFWNEKPVPVFFEEVKRDSAVKISRFK